MAKSMMNPAERRKMAEARTSTPTGAYRLENQPIIGQKDVARHRTESSKALRERMYTENQSRKQGLASAPPKRRY